MFESFFCCKVAICQADNENLSLLKKMKVTENENEALHEEWMLNEYLCQLHAVNLRQVLY